MATAPSQPQPAPINPAPAGVNAAASAAVQAKAKLLDDWRGSNQKFQTMSKKMKF